MALNQIQSVLFDLDGTLLDSAPTFTRIMNKLCAQAGREPVDPTVFRAYAGKGIAAMFGHAFGLSKGDPGFQDLFDAFSALYTQHIEQGDVVLFPNAIEILDALDKRHMPWGIVTNKRSEFTIPILQAMGIHARTRCLVCGDTTGELKPHPAPLLHAANQMVLLPQECLYVGDSRMDVEAALRANMPIGIVLYGYHSSDELIEQWPANLFFENVMELLAHI